MVDEQRDWGGYRAITIEAAQIRAELRQRPRVACPTCGTPLRFNDEGWGDCPFGHYTAYAPRELE